MREKLTETEQSGLAELAAACDEKVRYGGTGWCRTRDLCGTSEVRSSSTMLALVRYGYAESRKYGSHRQTQYSWRITPAGREALNGGNDE